MDLINHAQHESKDDYERVEPGELLEDCWFFGNLLCRSPRMVRSLSEPCSSLNYTQENLPGQSYDQAYESIKKLSVNDDDDDDEIHRPNLIRAPSVPSTPEKRSKRCNRKKSSSKNLVRAPSLPTSLETEELQDDEIEFSMGKLIRQASMNYSDTLPPRTHSSTKGLTRSCSISRHRSRRKAEWESIKIAGLDETQKSLIDLESEELQGFKDLGFDLDEKDLSPNRISMITGLPEKKIIEEEDDEEKGGKRSYLSEKWGPQSYSAPPVPRWVGKRSTEDMKKQIKFWARAVASNVRQEC
ncbi:hypothetical protein CASFOL_024425 [Castilleja foliolosa]|uniref:Uncharacterized protein n=1 Tax=Castilleja foliolosa TaxID=1961234 RepID=A0ABD3CQ33_9LAMI